MNMAFYRSRSSNYIRDDDPEGYFDELERALKNYLNEFRESETAVAKLEGALAEIEQIIEEIESELPDEPDWDDDYRGSSVSGERDGSRSVFDDVDI